MIILNKFHLIWTNILGGIVIHVNIKKCLYNDNYDHDLEHNFG